MEARSAIVALNDEVQLSAAIATVIQRQGDRRLQDVTTAITTSLFVKRSGSKRLAFASWASPKGVDSRGRSSLGGYDGGYRDDSPDWYGDDYPDSFDDRDEWSAYCEGNDGD